MRKPLYTAGKLTSLRLFLSAVFGKTDVSGVVSAWKDKGIYSNDGSQSTTTKRPTDNGTYLTFTAASGQNIDCGNAASVNINDKLTVYGKIRTTISTEVGIIDKYIGSTSGYFLDLLSGSGRVWGVLSKTNISATGTAVNDGNIHQIHGTITCSRKFYHKQYICDGAEPQIYKEGSTYYLFYTRWASGTPNIYVRSDSSPYFENSTESLIISNAQWNSGVWKDGSTYRIIITDTNNQNFILYTSSTLTSGYTSQGTILSWGNGSGPDAVGIADPCEIKIGNLYYLYYSAFSSFSPTASTVCYATSSTGTGTYTKQGTCVGNGTSTEFDYNGVADPEIIKYFGCCYIMFYTGYNASLVKQQQGYATSCDGINWTKFSGNPIHYFTDPNWEAGIYGPNEPTALLETDAAGNRIWRIWYRGRNDNANTYKIGYYQFDADNNLLPICGNETVVAKIYKDNSLESTSTLTGAQGIDYILNSAKDVYIGGNGVNTNYFNGDIFEIKIFDKEVKKI